MSEFADLDSVVRVVKPWKKSTCCDHTQVTRDSGASVCVTCGIELPSQKDKARTTALEPGRCQMRKSEEKGIWRDVEHMGFSEGIVRQANDIFLATTKGQIYRGNSRKAVIFACVFHAFKLQKNPQSCDRLIHLFHLERKVGLRGLKLVALNSPKDSLIRTSHITPVDLIREIMKQFEASDEQVAEVIAIYRRIENCSSVLNRARPQSTAAGVTYFYIRLKEKDITIHDFTEVVHLSELTVAKIAREVARLLEMPEVMV